MAHPELIYLYIEDIGYCFKQQEFVFSQNYKITYNQNGGRVLAIAPKENPFHDIYGNNITNISLLVGSNGCGKTTVLELLADPETFAKRLDAERKMEEVPGQRREEQTQKQGEGRSLKGWFSVYALGGPQTMRLIDGYNTDLISNYANFSEKGHYSHCFCFIDNNNNWPGIFPAESSPEVPDSINKIQLFYGTSPAHTSPSMSRVMQAFQTSALQNPAPQTSRPQDFRPQISKPRKSEGPQPDILTRDRIEFPDLLEFFRFICTDYREICSDIFAEHVVFSIKAEHAIYSVEPSDTAPFITPKDLFLLNLHVHHIVLLDSEYDLDYDEEPVRSFYYNALGEYENECGYEYSYDISQLLWYDSRTSPVYHGSGSSVSQAETLLPEIHKACIRRCASELAAFFRIPDIYFTTNVQIDIPAVEQSLDFIEDVFKCLHNYGKEGVYHTSSLELPFFRCEYRQISQGEEAFFHLFSGILQKLKEAVHDDNHNSNHSRQTTNLLLLDEPDLSMHPEWSRKFLSYMAELLPKACPEKQGEDIAFQIVISTHSPFMISDVLKDNILCLERGGDESIHVHPAPFGFLSNIHDIMADTFFIKSPFGELGSEIFKKIVHNIRKISPGSSPEDSLICDTLSLISEIGDEVVRKHLQETLKNKLRELDADKQTNRQRRIQRLEEELRILKGEDGE